MPHPGRGPIRIVTYNILLGGERRHDLILGVLRRSGADVIALQEASDLDFLRHLADELKMELVLGPASDGSDLNVAILSSLPVLSWTNRQHRGRMLRTHLECEVATPPSFSGRMVVHCVHLAARFGERANGEARRMREITAVLDGIARSRPCPHLIVGDFNALAPGDSVAATRFLARMAELRRARLVVRHEDGSVAPRRHDDPAAPVDATWLAAGIDPRLDIGVPRLPRIVGPLTGRVRPSPAVDRWLARFIERRTVQRLLDLGYTDCYRRMHPRARGYTCATWVPAARIDYIFASGDLAPRLIGCDLIGSRGGRGSDVAVASDHFPLRADFHHDEA